MFFSVTEELVRTNSKLVKEREVWYWGYVINAQTSRDSYESENKQVASDNISYNEMHQETSGQMLSSKDSLQMLVKIIQRGRKWIARVQ